MKRALILITVLTIGCLACALTVDLHQHHTAQAYLADLPPFREAALAQDWEQARAMHQKLKADWKQEAFLLDCLISHEYTREVASQLGALETAIEMGWQEEALQALDALEAALEHIHTGDFCRWENFL
ncbi:MAG: DUF4363 family protein [Candidatus Limiplasma sp.]|nr:DUF4363 family protein [Candidatus Limiplasma sp.]